MLSSTLAMALAAVSALGIHGAADPPVRLWLTTDSGSAYFRPGDQVRVRFRTADDAHVVILRADALGAISVLFPTDPEDMNLVWGGTTYEVMAQGQPRGFVVDETSGTGFVIAARSDRPIAVGRFARKELSGGWDYQAIEAARNGRSGKDALIQIAKALAADSPLDYDIESYTVTTQPSAPIARADTRATAGYSAGDDVMAPVPYTEQAPYQPAVLSMAPSLYPFIYDTYLFARGERFRHRPRQPFVPCQMFCYPNSPTSLVGIGPNLGGGGTNGSGIDLEHGDPASYLAVPWGPRAQVPRTVPQPANPRVVVAPVPTRVAALRTVSDKAPPSAYTPVAAPATIAAVSQPVESGSRRATVPQSALRSARPMTVSETRAMSKITFGPATPLHLQRNEPAIRVVNQPAPRVAAPAARPTAAAPLAARAALPGGSYAANLAPRGAVAVNDVVEQQPISAGTPVRRGAISGAEMRPRSGPSAPAPRPVAAGTASVGGQAYLGPRTPIVPRTVPRSTGK